MWFVAAALAQTEGSVDGIDSAEVRQMVDELQPRVEAYLGRPPIGPLEAGLLSQEEVRVAIAAPTPAVGVPTPSGDPLGGIALNAGVADDVRLAVYVAQNRGIYVVKEAVETLLAQEGQRPEHLRPILRCLLVHEIVHAVQHAYGTVPDTDPDRLYGWSAVREGHATRIELELCAAWEGPEIALRVVGLHGIDAPGTLAPGAGAAPYAWGRTLVDLLQAEDPELVWAAIAAPPPRWRDLAADIGPIVGGGWQDPAPVLTALRADDATPPSVRSSGFQPLGSLLAVPGGVGLPLVSAGWIVETPTRVVAVFRTVDRGFPTAIVDRRDELTRGSGAYLLTAGALEGDLEMDRGVMPRLVGRPGVARTLRLDLSTKTGLGGYHERWVATEHVLALIVTRGRAGAAGDSEALDLLLDQLPDGSPPTATTADLPALVTWLGEVRMGRDALERVTGPQWRLLDAGLAWQAGRLEPCGMAFGPVLVPGALLHPRAQAGQAYVCAAASNEIGTADRAAVLLDALPPIPAAIHARNLIVAGRPVDALAILDRTTGTNPTELRALADSRMRALRATKRWDELLAVATLPDGSPAARVDAAVALRRIGRTVDADDLLASACVTGEGLPPEPCVLAR